MGRFYLEQVNYSNAPELPDGVAMKAFVKTSGDTVGVVYINEAGGFILWREGRHIGTFDTLKAMYHKLDLIHAYPVDSQR